MATTSDLTVKLKVDTRSFDRSLRRVQVNLWLMQHGWQVLAAAGAAIFAIGVLLGVVAS